MEEDDIQGAERDQDTCILPDVNRERCESGDRERSEVSASRRGVSRAWDVDKTRNSTNAPSSHPRCHDLHRDARRSRGQLGSDLNYLSWDAA